MDPNYLLQSQFPLSPWHRALHRWALGVAGGVGSDQQRDGLPLLHVDLHGKVSEKLHLDLGAAPMEAVWPDEDQPFIRAFKGRLAALLDDALEKSGVVTQKGTQIAVNVDPCLHGFWGQDTVTTISHQSVLLGIPAVQFEMPPRLREQLVSQPELTSRFAAGLAEVYKEMVVPWWAARRSSRTPWPREMRLDAGLGRDVKEAAVPEGQVGFDAWSSQLLEELLELERTTSEVQI